MRACETWCVCVRARCQVNYIIMSRWLLVLILLGSDTWPIGQWLVRHLHVPARALIDDTRCVDTWGTWHRNGGTDNWQATKTCHLRDRHLTRETKKRAISDTDMSCVWVLTCDRPPEAVINSTRLIPINSDCYAMCLSYCTPRHRRLDSRACLQNDWAKWSPKVVYRDKTGHKISMPSWSIKTMMKITLLST